MSEEAPTRPMHQAHAPGMNLQNQEAFLAQFPNEAIQPTSVLQAGGQMRKRHESNPSKIDRIPVPSIDDLRFDAFFPAITLIPMHIPPTSHRRATSCDESPKLASQESFRSLTPPPSVWGSASATEDLLVHQSTAALLSRARSRSRTGTHHSQSTILPSPPYSSQPRTGSTPSPYSHRPSVSGSVRAAPSTHSRNTSNQSLNSSRLKSRPPSDAFYDPKTPTAASLPYPLAYNLASPPNPSGSIDINIRDGGGQTDSSRAVFGTAGVVLTLRGSQRPEDVDVSWSSSQGYDEDGHRVTTWELRIVPKASPPSFSEYRMAPVPAAGSQSGSPLPGSPRSSSVDVVPSLNNREFSEERYPVVSRNRKPSAGSEKTSGGSFSSESSGPVTPRHAKFGMLNNASEQEFLDHVSVAPLHRHLGRASSFTGDQRTISDNEDYTRFGSLSMPEESTPNKRAPHHFDSYAGADFIPTSTAVINVREGLESTFSTYLPIASPPLEVPHLSPPKRTSSGHRRSQSEVILTGLSKFSPWDDSEDEGNEPGANSQRATRKALARQKGRIASHWSDTDGETDDDNGNTSWSQIPDNNEDD